MRVLLATLLLVLTAAGAAGAEAQAAAALAADQARAEERMAEVEQRLLALAGLLANEQPGQAARLADALALSRGRFIVDRMAEARRMLDQGRMADAARLQEQASGDLTALLALLAASDAAGELQRLRALEARLAGLLARQAEAAAAGTEAAQAGVRGDSEAALADMQSGPGAAFLAAAVAHMARAERALTAGHRAEGNGAQAEAERSLGEAFDAVRAAIAAISAQQQAAARARIARLVAAMAADQESILADTRAAATALSESPASRTALLAVSRLAAREQGVADRAAEALALAGEAGGVALQPALAAVGADVGACRDRLKAGEAGPGVQWLQEGIVAELKALLAAVGAVGELSMGDITPGGDEQTPRTDRKTRDAMGDLRVVRAVQSAVQARTARLDQWRRSADAPVADVAGAAIAVIAGRQASVTSMLRALTTSSSPALARGLLPIAEASTAAGDMLQRALTDASVNRVQQRVVDGLDAIIAAIGQQTVMAADSPGGSAESRAQQAGAATAVPIQAADESMLSPFGPPPGAIAPEGPAAAAWLPELPEAERKKVLDAFATGRLPAHYRELLRDYNRRLAGEGE